MNKLTYIFKGNYANRGNEKRFISDVISSFDRDEVTGIGIKVNNNPWALELFTFVTIDTKYLQRERFLKWLDNKHQEKSVIHNVFSINLLTGGNIITFCNSFSLISFDYAFIWEKSQAESFIKNPNEIKLFLNKTREEFEKEKPQYAGTSFQEPVIFISHSSLDKETIAVPISDHLCSKEIPIWLDRNEIKLEDVKNDEIIYKKIYSGISICEKGIFIVTNNFFKTEWTTKELQICKDLGKKIIVLVSNEMELQFNEFKDKLKLDNCHIFYVDFSENDYLDNVIQNII